MDVIAFDTAHDYGVFRIKRLVTRAPRGDHMLTHHVLDRPDSVQVVAVSAEGEIIMVQQERYGTQETSLEFVAGLLDGAEDPPAAAVRELEEETGYRAAALQQLGWYYTDPAVMTNKVTVFVAEGCSASGQRHQDEGEDIQVQRFAPSEIPTLITSARITHGLSVAAWYLYQSHMQHQIPKL
jgi:8-oxo-dGTP pyrophosphatase MutT (NUDIX family)